MIKEKHILLILYSIVFTMIFYSVMVYSIGSFRSLAVKILTAKEPKTNNLASDITGIAAPSIGNPTSATSTATSTISDLSQVEIPELPKNHEYKLVRQVDPCTFNKLGDKGWEAFQFSTSDLESGIGRDENCKNAGKYDLFDWVLFVRTK